ncbi:TRAP transporter substrate-binding protein [Piscinibacter gummiphilus]|uniref:C4-dicarboxylate ABC transporter substrate-binding protein n=1 Tax=Piscinibacter gummiphilus TaxID=946333 RepID=A0A1W6LET5_9BURK|nr:TRAP transporter substrate-binding protein [Piscinibacter gummiphilus]ARN22771.1 C4-dicarboxylate ABC transporter substrate-binding protein [Piscinibacter gummiphilus]ATU67467.1 C4-dicarboxylate ABC transporter substrate-binding protein [Piscinibacter gummiphilus]GLS96579.1 exported protein [Piscinibacter gummiphilus]
MKRLIVATAATLCALAAHAASWNMSAEQPDANYLTQNVRQFAEDVKAATNGQLEFKVQSNSVLLKRPEVKRGVQQGIVPIGEVLMSALGNEDAMFEVDSVPFLASSFDASEKLWKAAREQIAQRLDKQGVVLVYGSPWPPQGIYTKAPVTTLADFKGARFRAYSASTSRMVTLMGAVPTTIQTAEVPQAFSTGVIDMMITSPATGVDTQAWDYVKHYYDAKAFIPQSIVIANKRSLAALPPEQRQAVLDAGKKAEARGWQQARELTAKLTQTLASRGISVNPVPAPVAADLNKIGATMADEWIKKAGADGAKVLDAYRR